jgi:hypothetical protein
VAAAQLHLTGTKIVFFRERYGGAYRLQVLTYTVQTPNPTLVEKELMAQKPAGIILTYTVLAGQDYQLLYLNNATYQVVYDKYPTYQGVMSDTPGV